METHLSFGVPMLLGLSDLDTYILLFEEYLCRVSVTLGKNG